MVIGYRREGEWNLRKETELSSHGTSDEAEQASSVAHSAHGEGSLPGPIRQEFGGPGIRGRQLLLPFEEDHIRVLHFSREDRLDRRRGTIWREGKVLYADFGCGGECA